MFRVKFRDFFEGGTILNKVPKFGFPKQLLLTILDTIEITGGKLLKNYMLKYEKVIGFVTVFDKAFGKIYKEIKKFVWVIGWHPSPNKFCNYNNV